MKTVSGAEEYARSISRKVFNNFSSDVFLKAEISVTIPAYIVNFLGYFDFIIGMVSELLYLDELIRGLLVEGTEFICGDGLTGDVLFA